jgi:hypothetical protein
MIGVAAQPTLPVSFDSRLVAAFSFCKKDSTAQDSTRWRGISAVAHCVAVSATPQHAKKRRMCTRVSKLLSIAIWIVVLLGLVEKVNINQTSDVR